MTSKICSKCNVDKDLGEFCKDNNYKSGYRTYCKECKNSKVKTIIKDQVYTNSKRCSKCNIDKDLGEFHKDKSRKDGLSNRCKECKNNCSKQYRIENKESISANKKEYRKKNTEVIKERKKKYHSENKEKISLRKKQWEIKNKDKRSEYKKVYRTENKEKMKQYHHEYKPIYNKRRVERKKHDESYRISCNLRGRLVKALKQKAGKKSNSTLKLIGCSWKNLHSYLDSKYGIIQNVEYDVDHIIPCSAFDFTDPNHQKACFHYTNLQKLPSKENQHQKSNKLPKDFNVESWVEKQLEQIKKIEDDNLGWETVLELQKTKTFQGFIDEEDKWW